MVLISVSSLHAVEGVESHFCTSSTIFYPDDLVATALEKSSQVDLTVHLMANPRYMTAENVQRSGSKQDREDPEAVGVLTCEQRR